MIVSFLMDLTNYQRYHLGWAYYLFASRCRENYWGMIVQQRYADWDPTQARETAEVKSGGTAWDYRPLKRDEIAGDYQRIIPESMMEQLVREKGSYLEASAFLQEKRYSPLEKLINGYFNEFESQYGALETIVTYPKIIASLAFVAKERHIPVLTFDAGPLRFPVYRGTAYLSGYNMAWGSGGRCERLFHDFCSEFETSSFFDSRELLALFLSKAHLPLLKLYSLPPVHELLVAGSYSLNPLTYTETRHNDWELIQAAGEIYGEDFIFRPDPGDRFKATFGVPEERLDYASPNILSVLESKRVCSVGGNMLFDTMLWNRQPYCASDNFFLAFQCGGLKDLRETVSVSEPFLNFFCFLLLAPMELTTTDAYIRWRLSHPGRKEIYFNNLDYYLSQINLDRSVLLLNHEERLHAILRARGAEEMLTEPFPRGEDDLGAAWKRAEQFVGFNRPVPLKRQLGDAKNENGRLTAELAKTRESFRSQMDAVKRETETLRADLDHTQKDLALSDDRNKSLENELDSVRNELSSTIDELGSAKNEIVSVRLCLHTIQQSASWRATAPIRKILDWFKLHMRKQP